MLHVNHLEQLEILTGNKGNKVKATYKLDTGMVATFNYKGQQIPELQGKYSPELHKKILQRSDNETQWFGYEKE